jgi:hypothetical protein
MPTKFDFLSPGIELREIDQSAIAAVPENDGLLLIGRAKKGPAMKPIKITSLSDFQAIFGTPMDGVKRGDPWREGNTGGGGWAAYAAEAYLAAGVGPVKFIRLAGVQEDGVTLATDKAGWSVDQAFNSTPADNDGAMGVFVAEKPTASKTVAADANLSLDFTELTTELAAGAVTLTVEVLSLTNPSLSFTIGLYDSGVPTSAPGTDVDIDLNGHLGSIGAIWDEIFTYKAAIEGLVAGDVTVTQPAGAGTVVNIQMNELGAGGNLKDITADATVFGATDTVSFANGAETAAGNGVLAAIFYAEGVSITLSGTDYSGVSATNESAHLIDSAAGGSWTATLTDGSLTETVTFNFDETSQNFIRNVFSTDATLFNPSAATRLAEKVFLGESFEYNVQRLGGYGTTAGQVAFVAGIKDGSNLFTNHLSPLREAKTGWFIGSQASGYKRLFRLCALDEGSDFHKTHIVRIKDLRKATTVRPEGSFTIEIARAGQRPSEYVEKFVNVTMNPDSPNYILKKIGDYYQSWNSSTGKIVASGSFNNESNLVRVELAQNGVNKTDLPLGFLGPAKIDTITLVCDTATGDTADWITGKNAIPTTTALKTVTVAGAEGFGLTLTIDWPTHGLSVANSYGSNNSNYPPSVIHGLSYNSQRGEENYGDIGIYKPDFDPHLAETAASGDAAYVFSLEHIDEDGSTGTYFHTNSFQHAFDDGTNGALFLGIKQFAAPFFGGTDGVDIKVENPFNDYALTNTPYAKYSMESAISQVADYYTSRYDLISIPGVTNSAIISSLVSQTEERGDALAIIDMVGIYQSTVDNGLSSESEGKVSTMVTTAEGGTVASSYAAAYYPNVRIADVSSGRGSVLMAPPSVAAIGAIAKSEALSQPWFAPAGFTRGGLAPLGGTGGANVVGTLEHLSKADRDDLYNVNINPIARFPATGDTVIFGQKTLQPTDTALDRINVRRMMIYLKKRIGGIADQFLFEQGVKATYDRFKATIEPILSEVRSEYGITEYKVVLDESTTTPDLQDRNIMYAKVFVKPARAIEYVVIDFVVTQSGVEF